MSYTPFLVGATALHWDGAVGFASSQRDWWAWWMACWGLCVLAYLTNPTAATFRTHLTSLSFHTHLRRLSSSSDAGPSSPTPGKALKRPSAPSHILSFSNRISLAVRTPPFTLRSYYLFSTVVMAPPPRTPSLLRGLMKAGDAVEEGREPAFKERDGELWVGAFGRWYAWSWESDEMEEEERRARLAKGVVGMEVEDDEDSEVPSSSASATSPDTDLPNPPLSPTSRTFRTSRPTKRVFRGGQRRPPSPTSLARLRSKAETSAHALPFSPPLPSSSANANGHSRMESEGEGFYLTRSTKDKGLPGLPFHVARSPHPPLPGHFHTDPPLPPPEPADPVLDELKTQLDELRTSTDEGEKRLQVELEGLRDRKKEEDAFRAELKSKTKGLEETKRVAELNRVEAERELGERKAVIKRTGERVDKLRDEIGAFERREMEVVERKEKKKKERKEREKKLKEDVGKKREELKVAEAGIDKLLAKVAGLEKTIDARRDMLVNRRNDSAARSMGFGPGAMMGGGMGVGMGMPPGINMFRRAPGPVGYNQSMPNSRPGSVRSGHFDHHAAQYDHSAFDPTPSALSSPTHSPSYPISAEDESPYAEAAFYSGGFAPDGYRPAPLVQQGFLEHRIQHRRTELTTRHSGDSATFAPLANALPSVDDIPASFLPFDFDSHDRQHEDAHTTTKPNRPQLSLPLQYLDSGLLEASTSPGLEGPLSPVTPHQASLIPRQLFQMLDEDDFVLAHQHSPTLGRGSAPWNGLGLELDGEDHEDGQRREQLMSPGPPDSLASPRFDLSPHALGSGPWDASDEQLLLANRMSPHDPDDLPRHGLSLNPDAKAFAFQPRSTSSPSTTPRTINSPSIASMPTHGVISPPAKSRMDFANSVHSSGVTGAVAPASRFSYDWQRTSPRNPATMVSAFNPFDDDDELLGPLKK